MKAETTLYSTQGAQGLSERSDCVVRALSIAACIDYSQAHALLKSHGRKDKRGTPLGVSIAALEELFPESPIQYCDMTLEQFTRTHKSGHYLAYTRSHALAVCDGTVHDWGSHPRYRVRYFWKLA